MMYQLRSAAVLCNTLKARAPRLFTRLGLLANLLTHKIRLPVCGIVDDEHSRIRYGLQMLFGGFATLSHRPLWRFLVVSSVQDAKVFGTELKQALNGTHTVKFNGKHHSNVEIQVASVVEEGAGAILSNRSQINAEGQNILIDFNSCPEKTLLVCNEGTLVQEKSKHCIDAISSLISSRTSRQKYAWEAGQSGHTEDLKINGAARYSAIFSAMNSRDHQM
jgi:hypothetical protein